MPSSRWLKAVPESKQDNEPEPESSSPVTPNVSMSDVRRAAREKAARDEQVETQPDAPVSTQLDSSQLNSRSPTPVETPVETPVTTPVVAPVETGVTEDRLPYLDATHTPSEKSVYSVMYRETMRSAKRERHFGFKELSTKTGIRSDATIRRALDGLIAKLSVEIISYVHGNPLGPRYRVYDPKEITRRRKDAGMEIDPQSKRIVTPVETPVATPVDTGVPTGGKTYGSTPAIITPVTPATSTGDINKENLSLNNRRSNDDDDAALAGLNATLKQAAEEVTGRELSASELERWRELGEVLATELKIAAARTTVSSAPSFLAEHLRRRLWKKDKRQLQVEATAQSAQAGTSSALSQEQIKGCPDCGGTGFKYKGENFTGGVEKCRHEKLIADSDPT